MMAQNWLLKLIEICILSLFCIQLASAFIIDDFEVVTDWTAQEDCSVIGLEETTKTFGTYSGKVTCTDGGDGTGGVFKALPNVNYVNKNISLWFWIDTSAWGQGTFSITLQEGEDACIDEEDFTATDDTWSHLNVNITTYGTYNSQYCDAVDKITISTFTDAGISGTDYFYLDDNPCEFSLVIGDALIENNAACTLNKVSSIPGNLNITDGTLEIQSSGALSILGGYIFIYPSTESLLQILSGGQING